MIDLTPLDVRKKKGDFRRGLRGYEPQQVDDFLDVVADRLDALVREHQAFGDQVRRLEQQVAEYREREKALTEALVTAQEMREEMRAPGVFRCTKCKSSHRRTFQPVSSRRSDRSYSSACMKKSSGRKPVCSNACRRSPVPQPMNTFG